MARRAAVKRESTANRVRQKAQYVIEWEVWVPAKGGGMLEGYEERLSYIQSFTEWDDACRRYWELNADPEAESVQFTQGGRVSEFDGLRRARGNHLV